MTRRGFPCLLPAAVLCMALAAAFWLGLVPQRLSPFAPLALSDREPWFLDLRLAALKADSALCRDVMKEPHISATPIADQPFEKGCGWRNALRVSQAGGAHLSAGQLSCSMAAALAMWIAHEVQPTAAAMFGSRVVAIRHMGTYACRNIVGSRALKPFRSQHATANAIDLSGFVLADGRHITVFNSWKGDGANARFLKSVKNASCRYFRVSIGPEFNAAHADHFHFDRGVFKSCR